jgi:signal transduction histidine kinase
MRAKSKVLESRIASLIEFARMETGEWRLGFEEVDAAAFLRSLAREFGEDAAVTGLSLKAELAAAEGIRLRADRVLLGRALENILANALRYAPPGSTISLGARLSGERLVLSFDDSGPGIPPAERERVFEAFHQGSGAREGEGSGLGLYIARSIIGGHGGSVSAGEAPGGGGRIVVELGIMPGEGREGVEGGR